MRYRGEQRWVALGLIGRNLKDAQAQKLERKLELDPADLDSRILLLGHYTGRRFHSVELAERRAQHIIWFVENRPEHPIFGSPWAGCFSRSPDGSRLYKEIKLRWLRLVSSPAVTTRILLNAANFFIHEEKELSEQCLLQARALAPDDYYVLDRLSFLYHLWRHPEQGRAIDSISIQKQLNTFGFALCRRTLEEEFLNSATSLVESADDSIAGLVHRGNQYAVRHLLRVPGVGEFFRQPEISWLAQAVVGEGAFPVRAILLDKIPGANWYVGWHQDVSIAVKERIETPGFGPWSMKAGVWHVQPPAAILEQMVALRLHLDDCGEDNGALNFFSGSHLHGVLNREAIDRYKTENAIESCPAKRGDVLVMHPLILHSSSPSKVPSHRRVLHVEYAINELPNGLQWAFA